jgi:hypothetical protein
MSPLPTVGPETTHKSFQDPGREQRSAAATATSCVTLPSGSRAALGSLEREGADAIHIRFYFCLKVPSQRPRSELHSG